MDNFIGYNFPFLYNRNVPAARRSFYNSPIKIPPRPNPYSIPQILYGFYS